MLGLDAILLSHLVSPSPKPHPLSHILTNHTVAGGHHMHDNGLQRIASDIRKNNRIPPLKAIMAIIFVLPIIIHGFKWGWIYPIIILIFASDLVEHYLGVSETTSIILQIILFCGGVALCIWRVRKMRKKRKTVYMPRLYTPSSMRDYD